MFTQAVGVIHAEWRQNGIEGMKKQSDLTIVKLVNHSNAYTEPTATETMTFFFFFIGIK